ncbi:hypothetical protein Fcan01_27925 [Folsomia candida]|uniref:Uncharacterized protein n=1 Tax=Folsomia candida TaxID=158441 RepID=A0A226CX45_FOLCA|nr:hypothetical protein Fcan01_27925 [Folsomia candida]
MFSPFYTSWILHGAENYTTGSGYSYISEWEWETSGCVKSFTGSRPKSLRMTGVPGSINAPSINFYPEADFEGEHTLVADDIPDVDLQICYGHRSQFLLAAVSSCTSVFLPVWIIRIIIPPR